MHLVDFFTERDILVKKIIDFLNNDSGATAIGYGLIAALIAVVIVAVLRAIGTNLADIFGKVRDNLT